MAQLVEMPGKLPITKAHGERRFYQPELDGLRFYAFLAVFVSHALPIHETSYRGLHVPLPWLWPVIARSGGSGVDVFFALSAFLITSLLLKERQETGSISLRHFYIRRILRIWPLYFLVIALGVVIAQPRQSHLWYYTQSLPWYYVAGYLLFAGNWVYAAFGAAQSICFPLWTVSIEEQFYLVWPVLVKILKRRGVILAGVATFLLATVSQVALVLSRPSGNYIYFGSASRCGSLALGILLALYVDRLPKLTAGKRFLLAVGGLIGFIVSWAWLMDHPRRVILGWLTITLSSGAILYGTLYSTNKLVTGGWAVRLGKISYGLYMLHATGLLIVLSLLRPGHGWRLLATMALGFLMTGLLAFASYRWIESPFLRLKTRFATVPSRPI